MISILAASFTEISIDLFYIVLFLGAAIFVFGIIWAMVYKFGGWSDYGYSNNPVRSWISVLVGVIVAIPFLAVFIVIGANFFDNGDDSTFSTSGGLGPNTVCWYELVNNDTVVVAGKTPIVIDGSEQRTVCNKDPDAIPEEIKSSGRR